MSTAIEKLFFGERCPIRARSRCAEATSTACDAGYSLANKLNVCCYAYQEFLCAEITGKSRTEVEAALTLLRTDYEVLQAFTLALATRWDKSTNAHIIIRQIAPSAIENVLKSGRLVAWFEAQLRELTVRALAAKKAGGD